MAVDEFEEQLTYLPSVMSVTYSSISSWTGNDRSEDPVLIACNGGVKLTTAWWKQVR
jgi:hypothetical protein